MIDWKNHSVTEQLYKFLNDLHKDDIEYLAYHSDYDAVIDAEARGRLKLIKELIDFVFVDSTDED